MSKIIILGATGSLGRHVVRQAVSANHEVSVLVRSPSRLPEEVQEKVCVYESDLSKLSINALSTIFQGHEVVINTAGYVADQQTFIDLTDHIVASLELIPGIDRPVCWFMAGAALLDIDEGGRRGVDLPVISATYWPHRVNFERIRQTSLDWRILCPGPLVEQQAVGVSRMRVSLDRLPLQVPSSLKNLPEVAALSFFTSSIPEIIIPYADAAALMLENISSYGEMSRHRVGMALPIGMRGKKESWTAKPKTN